MIKKILVPLDGSDLAESARPYAEQIAMKTGAEVLLLTSVYQDDSWVGQPAQVDPKWVPLGWAVLGWIPRAPSFFDRWMQKESLEVI